MTLLPGRPRWRRVEQGIFQGLVVCEKDKITALQQETEVVDRRVSCQEFSVKGGVFGFGGGKFFGEKCQGAPGDPETLLKNSTHMRVGCNYSQGDSCFRFRVSKDRNRGEEKFGTVEGGVEDRGPLERITRNLQGVGEWS